MTDTRPVDALFDGRRKTIAERKCYHCGRPAGSFSDDVARAEYAVSGFCQECQDWVFRQLDESEWMAVGVERGVK